MIKSNIYIPIFQSEILTTVSAQVVLSKIMDGSHIM